MHDIEQTISRAWVVQQWDTYGNTMSGAKEPSRIYVKGVPNDEAEDHTLLPKIDLPVCNSNNYCRVRVNESANVFDERSGNRPYAKHSGHALHDCPG